MSKRKIAPYRIGQIVSTIILNAYILAYIQKKIIYAGFFKSIPEPVLNCYGGPLSVFACPLGSFQQILGIKGGSIWQIIPWVPLGIFIIFGAFVGRAACAWMCPFGLWQDLLYKIKLGPEAKAKRWLPFIVTCIIGLISIILLSVFLKLLFWKALLFGWLPFILLLLLGVIKGKMELPKRWYLGGTIVGAGLGFLIGLKYEINLGIASGIVAMTLFSLLGGVPVLFISIPLGFVLSLLGKPVHLGPFAGVELGFFFILFALSTTFLLDHLLKIKLPLTRFKFVFLILVAGVVAFWTAEPWFCKLCPQGTLEAGIPLVLWDPVGGLRNLVHWLFYLKVAILLFVFWTAIIIKRPFCRVVCPIGAIYSLFNKISLLRLKLNRTTCTNCGLCRGVCPTDIEPNLDPNQPECIRCFECVWNCPRSSLKISI